jgi:hypothetical protein
MRRLLLSLVGISGILAFSPLLAARPAAGAPTPTPAASPLPTVCPPGPLTMAVLSDGVLTWPNLPASAQPFQIDFSFCDKSFHYEVPGTATSFQLPPEALAAIDCCGTRSILVSSSALCSQAFVEVASPSPSCVPPATPTTATIQAPPSGDSHSAPSSAPPLALVALGFGLVGAGLVSFIALRTRKA